MRADFNKNEMPACYDVLISMPDGIALTIVNESDDKNNSDIVIFQKNVAAELSETAVAWQAIHNLGPGSRHPLFYSSHFQVNASDSWGNYTPHLLVRPGDAYQMVESPAGNVLRLYPGPASPGEMDVRNDLSKGSIAAHIYRDGKLLATRMPIAPGQKAVFGFSSTIFIGVVSQIEEGQIINAAIISTIHTEFDLLGIKSADIVMTGGGAGREPKPFVFSLQNVRYA
jgi:hypothetical protein